MATQLIQVVAFANVGAGLQTTLPHNINVQGRALIPDFVMRDNADFTINIVDANNVTVTNTSGAPANCNVWLEFKHTTQRWFGAAQTASLTPNPFVAAVGGGAAIPDPLVVNSIEATVNLQAPNGIFFLGGQNPNLQYTRIVMLEDGSTGNGCFIMCGSGDPTGTVTAPVGSLWLRIDGGAGSSLYVKEGPTDADWAAK